MQFKQRLNQKKVAFTLIELLVVIAIIGLLTGLLVTNVTRSLSVNKVSDDVTLMESKIEYIRLLAGSTQQSSTSTNFQADPNSTYYALVIPAGSNQTSYSIVHLSSDLNNGPCSITVAASTSSCLIEQDKLSSGITLTNLTSNVAVIAFKAPIKELTSFSQVGATWQANQTTNFPSPLFRLTFSDRTATVSIDNFTGKITTVYN